MRKKNSKMVELVDGGEGESKIRYRGEEREEERGAEENRS